MGRSAEQLRTDAERIWWAGVKAVQPEHLLPQWLQAVGNSLWIGNEELDLRQVERIAVVGAGKASAAMAVALENQLGPELLASKQVQGWVNVPADCLQPTRAVHLHAARPAGVNEPRPEGVAGSKKILELVAGLGPRDLCFCLISGGGSALLPLPIEGVSLRSKIEITRSLAASGADIGALNAVRREISSIKGGGLAQHCAAGRVVSFILSDVMGDDLETIASGPTVLRTPTPQNALEILGDYRLLKTEAGREIQLALGQDQGRTKNRSPAEPLNLVIGNNALAVDSAGIEAEKLGYSHAMISGNAEENSAEAVGRHLANTAAAMRDQAGPDCLITGGESTVQLADETERGKGGRNQQVALAALAELSDWSHLALLSAGTDGEDGPTDAAGAMVDRSVAVAAGQLDAKDYLKRNDAYHFFEQTGGLFKTGPTGTNVCDLRVMCVDK